MEKDNKNLLKYLAIILAVVLLTYELPHDSYSIIEYIIPPIPTSKGTIFISGFIPLVLFIIGIRGIFKLERFKYKSKIFVFLTVIIIVIPLMIWTLDYARTTIHWVRGDGLAAVDIEESNIGLSGSESEVNMDIELELKDYSRKENKFKIRVYIPESWVPYTGKEFYDLENYYFTQGDRSITNIEEGVNLKLDSKQVNELFESEWFLDDVEYELYNDKEKVRIIQHGL